MRVSTIDTVQLPVSPEHLTVVIAAFNEETSIPLLHPRLCAVLAQLHGLQTHVLYVDDGSTDGTWDVLHALTGPMPTSVRCGYRAISARSWRFLRGWIMCCRVRWYCWTPMARTRRN